MASLCREPRVHPLADSGILFTFGDEINIDLSHRIGQLVALLDAHPLLGIIDLVPSYTTLVAMLDPHAADPFDIAETICGFWDEIKDLPSIETASAREIVVPVAYGGIHGPDLNDVAAHAELSTDEVVRRHAGDHYLIGALGFAPGFSYLIGLPPELATPRRATPRTSVPAGSVGIGGSQTGVYALPTPGGWSLIGQTPLRLFRPERTEPFLIRAGDRMRFEPISDARYDEIAAEEMRKDTVLEPVTSPHGVFHVLTPGLQTSIQDLGRRGYGRFGVSPGGAADRHALVAANRLTGNPPGEAALEITLIGPRLRIGAQCTIAIAGANLGARLNGSSLPNDTPVDVEAGDELWFNPAIAASVGSGARAYLAVSGGFDVPIMMGSRSTDLTAGFGGWHGRSLRAGDRLPIFDANDDLVRETESGSDTSRDVLGPTASYSAREQKIRIVRGPQADRFDESVWTTFLGVEFTVSSQSNRLGLRLDGPSLAPTGGADVISEGIVTGSIQVTGGGQPIVMLPARATIGGYAKIATVISVDLDLLGQKKPGDRLRFSQVSVEEAMNLARNPSDRSIPTSAVGIMPAAIAQASVNSNFDQPPSSTNATLSSAVMLARELAKLNVALVEVSLPAANFHLRIARNEDN